MLSSPSEANQTKELPRIQASQAKKKPPLSTDSVLYWKGQDDDDMHCVTRNVYPHKVMIDWVVNYLL